jgi:hypothetical protein
MKKVLYTILKFLLVLTIFLGLQGRVLIRYAEIFHIKQKSELAHSGVIKVKANIIHRKLQCYTQHFQALDIPISTFFFSLITASLIIDLLYISFKEKLSIADSVRLLPLRAPPIF